ncbi:hypothetical protein [Clostridium sp.]|uniref:hypothetical protein n=1 Tax=Clostridium sp. TaxID=1506 RepID=UPI00260DE219|nr:hypothetical protein [Clostridium sp.]
MNKNIKTLATKIANTMNEINNFTFSTQDINESINEYSYQLENEKSTILEVLKEEYENSNNKEILSLIENVLAF